MEGALNIESLSFLANHKFRNKAAYEHILTYVYYMYSRSDMNTYRHLPPAERSETIIRDCKLFPWQKKATESSINAIKGVSEFIDDFVKYTTTPAERMLESMRARMEKYERIMVQTDPGDPRDEEAMFKAILSMQKIFKEYEKEVHIEKEQDEWKANMRLFEIPDDQWQ